ncbi:MAG: GNAT family N-acetyltransferase [Sphingomonadaceae bacterium]|nr:GNAT family N-acetyltransferase [Sphingomonadaceae bacterium]
MPRGAGREKSAALTIPVLATRRLRLRPFTPADLDDLARIYGDPRFATYVGKRPRSRSETWLRLLAIEGHWRFYGYGFWAIEFEGRLAGSAGIQNFERDMVTPPDAPEVGWGFAPDAWGVGLATEAVAAVLDWADANGPKRLVALIDEGNSASIRVAQKAGFGDYRVAEFEDGPHRIYERLAGAARRA